MLALFLWTTESSGKRTDQEGHEIELIQGPRRIPLLLNRHNEATNGRRPPSKPAGDDPPVEAVREPVVRVMHAIQVTKLDASAAQDVEIADHNTHDGREEDGERTQHRDERRSLVDQLPRLHDPHRNERDHGATLDVDVLGEQTRQVDAAGHGVAAHVLEHAGQGEAGGEEEHTRSGLGGAVARVHHAHEQVRRVPEDLAVDLLAGAGDDQADEADERAGDPGGRDGARDVVLWAAGVAGEVGAVCDAGRDAADHLVDAAHHEPGSVPGGGFRDRLSLAPERADALGGCE